MNTLQRAEHIAQAAAGFSLLGTVTADGLVELVRAELGHAEALDGFRPCGAHQSLALAPRRLLHIISGNTPHAGLQTLIRGLLLGSHNLCKTPGRGAPELARFAAALPGPLAALVEVSPELPQSWLASADAMIVFGGDDTIAHFRELAQPGQTFVGYGSRVSFGVVFEPGCEAEAARDASLFDQQGCLSPHLFYVAGDARGFAERLAGEMADFEKHTPRSTISAQEAASIFDARATAAFRAAQGEEIAVWHGEDTTAWTVIWERDPAFVPSCLNRVIRIKPLPAALDAVLAPVRPHLSTAGIWPATEENAARLAGAGVSRICPIGRMQLPPLTWHEDGQRVLAPLVRWVDLELRPPSAA